MKENREIYFLQAEFCRGLTHPLRIMIIEELAKGFLSVSELAERLDAPMPTVSQHLKVLWSRGLLIRRKKGNQVFYKLKYPEVIRAFKIVRKILMRSLSDRLEIVEG